MPDLSKYSDEELQALVSPTVTQPNYNHLSDEELAQIAAQPDVSALPPELHQEALQRAGSAPLGTETNPYNESQVENLPKTSSDTIQLGNLEGVSKPGENPQEIAKIVSESKTAAQNKPAPSDIESLLRSIEQGTTMGTADEIKAAIAPIIAENVLAPLEGVSKKDLLSVGGNGNQADQRNNLYNISLENQNQQLKADRESNPTATLAGDIIGGGIGAAGGLAALAKVAPEAATYLTTGKNFWDARKKDAIIGATLGALTGAGSANPLEGESRISGAGSGALKGGIAAPVVGGVVAGGKSIADNVGSATQAVKRATVGAEPLDILNNKIENPAAVKSQLENSQIGILPDVAGDSMRGLTRLVGKTEGGRDIVNEALTGRSEDAVKRVVGNLKQISPVDSYFGNLEDLKAARQAVAEPLYRAAYTENQSISSPAIDKMLETPAGKKALNYASTQMQNDQARMGIPDQELREQAALTDAKFNGRPVAAGLNLRSLDYVKKGLDSQIGEAYGNNDRDTGGILTGLKNQFLRELDAADKTGKYADARKVYSGAKSLENYQEMGKDFTKMDPEEITSTLKDASPGEKDAFKIGVRKSLQDVVNKTADGADPAKRIFGNTYKRDQLRAAMENDQQFNEFTKKMQDEIAAAQTKFAVLGGSRTDINAGLMDKNLMEKTMDQVIENGTSKSAWLGVLADGLKSRYYGINPTNAKQLAGILTDRDKGIQAMKDLIALNEKNPAQLRILDQAIKEIGPAPESVRFSIGKALSDINKIRAPSMKGEGGFVDYSNIPNFKDWFGKSKILDEKGEPLKVYHGTKQNFNDFDSSKIGTATNAGKAGFYFTNDKSFIKNNGYIDKKGLFGKKGKILETYLKIEKPYLPKYPEEAHITERRLEEIKKEGHDGIIKDLGGGQKEYIVFSPNQIKRTGNNE